MRFMLIVRANGLSEAGILHTHRFEEGMAEYRKALAQAGKLLAAEELQPSSSGVRIRLTGRDASPEVNPGPFPLDHRLIAGYVVIEAETADEAVEWAMKMPVPAGCEGSEVDVRELREWAQEDRNPRVLALEADLQEQVRMLNQMQKFL
ncbi:YciI family protein [Paenibacillus cellulositrophicus]|uniref:YciI family protein n=1 Tax=Paenibacillus cellulositrophicus TaxID=562959 RepID=UPI003F7E869A